MLLDGEREGGVQEWAGVVGAALGEQEFAEKNAGHHPVGLARDAELIMRDGFGGALFGFEGLREAEVKEFVAGLAGEEGLELFDAGRHAVT